MKTTLFIAAISIFRMGGDIVVKDAPNGAVLRTMGGDIRVESAAGRTVAKTMGGNIEIDSLDGSADAGSMGGDIRVTVNGSGPGHDLDLHSLGGRIEVILRSDFDGDFVVEVEDGSGNLVHHIISDFPLITRESTRWRVFDGRRAVHTATGRTGSGTNRVRITTIGSDVTIRKK